MTKIMIPPCPSEEEVHDCIASMYLALMEGDLEESDRANTVYACHLDLTEELYLAVWEKLDAPFRRAWKAYVDQERAVRRTVQRDCGRSGR
jgi:poly-beta-hydroxyalkanoate depolymerase